jgi:hypothetical protein
VFVQRANGEAVHAHAAFTLADGEKLQTDSAANSAGDVQQVLRDEAVQEAAQVARQVATEVAMEEVQRVQLATVIGALSGGEQPRTTPAMPAEGRAELALNGSEETSTEALLTELHSAGFVTVSGHHVDASTLRAVLNTIRWAEDRSGENDGHLQQLGYKAAEDTYYLRLACQLGLLRAPKGVTKYMPLDEVMALVTEATDVLGERHADCAPRDSLRAQPQDAVPLVLLHAVMGGIKLWVWPQDGRAKVLIELKEGDILFMRGDCGHQGACYVAENVRVHAFIDCCQKSRKRQRSQEER